MSFSVYILRCSDGSYYVGHTDDLEKRLQAHADGEISGYTASRRPFTLALVEECTSRIEALTRERQLKGWSRNKKEALIREDWKALHELAQARPSTSSGRTGGGGAGQGMRTRGSNRSARMFETRFDEKEQ